MQHILMSTLKYPHWTSEAVGTDTQCCCREVVPVPMVGELGTVRSRALSVPYARNLASRSPVVRYPFSAAVLIVTIQTIQVIGERKEWEV